MAGVAMINGAINGLTRLYPDAEFAAVMVQEKDIKYHPKLVEQYSNDDSIRMIVDWADCLIDLGGLCKGYDPYRHEYIDMCRKKDKPYVYMAVSFEHPDPRIVKDVPATARGIHSSSEYTKASGFPAAVVPDISFLIEPKPSFLGHGAVCYTTHKGKPWHKYLEECMDCANLRGMVQVVFKPDDPFTCWEPCLGVAVIQGSPEYLYGVIAGAKEVKTCRYHAAVGAIMAGVLYSVPDDMPNLGKYKDLEYWIGKDIETIRKEAFYSCEFVKEVLHG